MRCSKRHRIKKTSRISLISGLLLSPLSACEYPDRFSSSAGCNFQLLEPNIFLRLSIRTRERDERRAACGKFLRMAQLSEVIKGWHAHILLDFYKRIPFIYFLVCSIYNLHFQMRFNPAPIQTNIHTLIYRGRYLAFLFTPVKKGL